MALSADTFPFPGGTGRGITQGKCVHSKDGATLLTQILYCPIDVEKNTAILSLHLQVTCVIHLPASLEHKHISAVALRLAASYMYEMRETSASS